MTRAEILAIAKPILFNTIMTRAVMDDIKGVTRRVIKPQPTCEKDGTFQWESWTWMGNGPITGIENSAPYKVGDYLYVRETWGCYTHDWQDALYFVYKSDYPDGAEGYWYEPEHINWCDLPKWRPSIHMPKEAARTFLQVTGVKAERLQDITEEQAEAEGIQGYTKDGKLYRYCTNIDSWAETYKPKRGENYWQGMPKTAIEAFSLLWNNTVKPSEQNIYSWDANPWVWAYDFKKVEAEDRP